MTEPIRFDGISLPVSDVDRSVAFYQQFGFELLIRHDDFALLRLGEGTVRDTGHVHAPQLHPEELLFHRTGIKPSSIWRGRNSSARSTNRRRRRTRLRSGSGNGLRTSTTGSI
jgi:catechol 2,3-dioxygenase-like lactoylglutathione lyase family enzyme